MAKKQVSANSDWVHDIVAAYKSATFKTGVLSDRFNDGFTLPDYPK